MLQLLRLQQGRQVRRETRWLCAIVILKLVQQHLNTCKTILQCTTLVKLRKQRIFELHIAQTADTLGQRGSTASACISHSIAAIATVASSSTTTMVLLLLLASTISSCGALLLVHVEDALAFIADSHLDTTLRVVEFEAFHGLHRGVR